MGHTAQINTVESWEKALPNRLRTLLLTGPIHRLEENKGLRGQGFEKHDLRAIALRILDAIIERMGLGYGASREAVFTEIRPMILQSDDSLTPPDADAFIELVIERLLNENEKRRAFTEPYAVIENGCSVWKEFSFHLLEERSPDGNIYLRVTTEGIHLYTGMLGYDIEDAQIANEVVLKYQISRGRLNEAVQTAREAEFRSIQYEQCIRGFVHTAQRDIRQVDWAKDALRAIQNARDHIINRLAMERQILEAVEDRFDHASPEDAKHLATLKSQINRCIDRHLQLHHVIITANPEFLEQQLLQGFRSKAFNPLPDLDREVLRPVLLFTLGQLDTAIQSFGRVLNPASVPPVMDLESLVSRLLAPLRLEVNSQCEVTAPELNEVDIEKNPFAESDVDNLLLLFNDVVFPINLSALLSHAEREQIPVSSQRYVVLDVLKNYGAEDDVLEYDVTSSGDTFQNSNFYGHDLIIHEGAKR